MVAPIPLSEVQQGHPCLWGAIETGLPAPLVTARHARLLPTRPSGAGGEELWWRARTQGVLDQHDQPIAACTDLRGVREIYPLLPRQFQPRSGGGGGETAEKKVRELVLYGGTIFNHFGHLALDLTRLNQLLPLFRRSKASFWFHYPALQRQDPISHPLVLEWFDCLGIRDRVRLVQREILCNHLITAEVLYRDRGFVRQDFPAAARGALNPRLQERLLARQRCDGRIAYLSRHGLSQGTTRFEGEEEVVRALQGCANIDVIQPETLSIEAKLALYRDYAMVTGFAQACMNMKYFTPYIGREELAPQLMFVAGPQSLSSNWVNLDRAARFGDRVLDCSPPDCSPDAEQPQPDGDDGPTRFQRSTRFDVELVVETLRGLDRR
ncbi:MAG: glycosyltransferase 61 family protein [Cyanobacteriota bacterium]